MVVVGAAGAGPLRRQERLQAPPLRVRQFVTFHARYMGAKTAIRTLGRHTLALQLRNEFAQEESGSATGLAARSDHQSGYRSGLSQEEKCPPSKARSRPQL
jgi:hypothetical protein